MAWPVMGKVSDASEWNSSVYDTSASVGLSNTMPVTSMYVDEARAS